MEIKEGGISTQLLAAASYFFHKTPLDSALSGGKALPHAYFPGINAVKAN
jgi:hypothetical protein